jgi:tetratricopeptide (TPR) repeat protein
MTAGLEATMEEERKLGELLSRASEKLRADKLDEAEKEINAALELRKDDLRVRNLRGLLLFRGSRYEEARAVYLELSQTFPDDAAIRLNLGLVELRMGRHVDAAVNLKKVVAVEPDNARAQGYLGLALMRAGDLKSAMDAFKKGGQGELAKQVEERMAQADEALQARGELRRAASDGEKALSAEQPFGAVELEQPMDESRRGGSWQLRLPGERPPMPGPEGPHSEGGALPLLLEPPRPVSAFATSRLLRPGGPGESFSLAEGGMLVLRVDGRLPTRTFGAIASTGQLTFEPLMRRVRGHAIDEPFGDGGEAVFAAVGTGLMVVAPRGGRFTLLALADDIVYVREPGVYAFEESLIWENGRVPGGGAGAEGARVVQFRGNGRIVLRTQRAVFTLKVDPESPLFVESSTLIGWIGRVVPRIMHGDNGQPTPYIEASGEGVLILEEPPPL